MKSRHRLMLEPVLSSVARARGLVGDLAARHGFDPDVASDATLVVSELVTNAVLHARTSVYVAVGIEEATVRIEVTDASEMPVSMPSAPAAIDPVGDAFDEPEAPDLDDLIDALGTTGRGMELVASIAERWGVTPNVAGGKTVWAEMGLHLATPDAPVPRRARAGAAAGTGAASPPDQPGAAEASDGGLGVRLVAVPVRLIVDANRNFDDTIRELQVIALSDDADARVSELARTATRLLDDFGSGRSGGDDAVRRAQERGDRLVDLHLVVGAEASEHVRTLDSILSAVAAARATGKLLAMAPSPEILAFRLWYRDELLRQLGGGPARPCPFPAARPSAGNRPTGTLSERRRRLLAALRGGVAEATDPAAVAARSLERVCADTGAAFANLMLVEPDGLNVSSIHRLGYTPDEPNGRRYRVSEDNPVSEAVRTAEPIVLRTPDERMTRYPRLVPSRPIAFNRTAVWVPLGDAAPAAGVLVVGFARARDFNDRDLHYLLEVARVIHLRLVEVGGEPFRS